MNIFTRRATTLLLFASLGIATKWASAQTAYPMLMSLKPVAAQVGQSSEHTLKSRYTMLGAYNVVVTGEGVTGEIIHPEVKEGDKPEKPETPPKKDASASDEKSDSPKTE
jgi:hypothetical protein